MIMDRKTAQLIETEFLAFAMKAFASLNKGKSLGNDPYLKLLAERLTHVAARKTKRLVVSLPPRIALAKTICPVMFCKRAAGSNSSYH
jgi:hypothetical protein